MVLKGVFIGLLLSCSYLLVGQELLLSADTSAMKIGEHLELTLEYRDDPVSRAISWPNLQDSIPGGWEIISKSAVDSAENSIQQRFKVTRWDTGYVVVPPIAMAKDYAWVESNPLLIYVGYPDAVSETEIRDIKEIREVSYTLWDRIKDNAIAILITLVVTAALVWFTRYLSQRKKQPKVKEAKKAVAPKIPAHIIALKELKDLEESQLWQKGKVKEYHVALSDIARQYLENRYRISAMEKTSREIVLELRTMGISSEELQRLKAGFAVSDMAKFAKYKPSETENETVLRNIREFVEQTAEVVQKQA